MENVVAAVSQLPRGLCGVVFRHDAVADRERLGRAVARVCRQRRLALSVAEPRLAWCLRAGVHLRGGRGPKPWRFATASAHGAAQLVRARRAGAVLTFLSPVYATASHPGASGLGVLRWARCASRVRGPVAALGGLNGQSVRRLPWPRCPAIGAIAALVA